MWYIGDKQILLILGFYTCLCLKYIKFYFQNLGNGPFLSSLPFLKFWKKNLIYFGHKHVETGSN